MAVPVLAGRRHTVAVTGIVPADVAASIRSSVAPGTLVDYRVFRGAVVVAADPSATFHTVLAKGNTPVFDTKKYGPELAPVTAGPVTSSPPAGSTAGAAEGSPSVTGGW